MKFFSPDMRTVSVVRRWGIVWTLTQDTVAQHSFFVALYADQISSLIRWKGPRGALLHKALCHDMDEILTGDLPAPAKAQILDTEKAANFIAVGLAERLPYVVEDDNLFQHHAPQFHAEAKRIIKVADRLDALLFLTVERRLGNSVIAPRIPECWDKLVESWAVLPGDGDMLMQVWNEVVIPAVKAHETTGGYGI